MKLEIFGYKLIRAIFLVVLFFGLLGYVYEHTKTAYQNVGFNNGKIYEKEKILETLRLAGGEIPSCRNFQIEELKSELLTVKARSLHILEAKDGIYKFCEYR